MGGIDTTLAITALTISLVALFTTFIQVLQQFFATAEGYRRCNSSVMGAWAKRTYRRWRWMEFRYETLYSTPEFCIAGTSTSNLARVGSEQVQLITGDDRSRKMTWTSQRPENGAWTSNEQASWIPFLEALQDRSQELKREDESMFLYTPLPALIRHERSWDFIPADVVRPLASSNLTDMCILIRRLGMSFKEDGFRPDAGILNAEGAGHEITSTVVRGLRGPCLEYVRKPSNVDQQQGESTAHALIWKTEADLMSFGILPGNPDFTSFPKKFVIGTEEDVLNRLSEFDLTLAARNHIRDNLKVNFHWVMSFIDLIPLAAPMLRTRGSTAIRIPAPYLHSPQNMKGLLYLTEGFKVFHYRLRDMVENDNAEHHIRQQRRDVLTQYEKLKTTHGDKWESDENEADRQYTLEFLNDVHDCYNQTTEYFKLLERETQTIDGNESRFSYFDLVKAHIATAVFYWPESGKFIKENRGREHFNARVDWHAEGMHVYFDYLPKYVKLMKAAGCLDEERIKDAWVTLIFRAFCWHRCHILVEGFRIPSRHYGSPLPVYIG